MDIRKYKNVDDLAENFAKFLANQIDQSDSYNIALSGGSTPKLLFDVLKYHYKEVINWPNLNVYWGDERCVPPEDSESNFGAANNILFKELAGGPNVYRMKGESPPEEEAVRYGKLLKTQLPSNNDLPVFDLIILGMGEDGHTASIFPHQIDLMNSNDCCAVAEHPISGQKRITLTGQVINNARMVVFLIGGESKAERIREIHYGDEISKQYPAAHVDPVNGSLIWFLDEGAAKYLN